MCLCSTVASPSWFPVASIHAASEGSPSHAGFANGSRALAAHGVPSCRELFCTGFWETSFSLKLSLISACTCGHKVDFFQDQDWYLDDSFSEHLQICM